MWEEKSTLSVLTEAGLSWKHTPTLSVLSRDPASPCGFFPMPPSSTPVYFLIVLTYFSPLEKRISDYPTISFTRVTLPVGIDSTPF